MSYTTIDITRTSSFYQINERRKQNMFESYLFHEVIFSMNRLEDVSVFSFNAYVSFLGIIRKEWRDYGLFAMKGHGFTFRNGELIVPENGVYHVYSQVYFNHNDIHKDPNIAHFVYKKSGSDGERILTSLVTRSVKIGNSPVLFNGYTAGMFYLKKGDRLMVGVSEELLRMAQFVESLSYFGAFLIERY